MIEILFWVCGGAVGGSLLTRWWIRTGQAVDGMVAASRRRHPSSLPPEDPHRSDWDNL